jgi:hypothetical protein
MLLFQKRFHAGLRDGSVTLTFRRWKKPLVRPAGRYRCHPIGVLEVDALTQVTVAAISAEDARRSGFASKAELVAYLQEASPEPLPPEATVFRVELHYGGDGDRVQTALETTLTESARLELTKAITKLDADEPWTLRTLLLIREHPHLAASKLAPHFDLPTPEFKARVVKLKKLGLTQSFEVGYEVSPRGHAWLALTEPKARARAKARPPKAGPP